MWNSLVDWWSYQCYVGFPVLSLYMQKIWTHSNYLALLPISLPMTTLFLVTTLEPPYVHYHYLYELHYLKHDLPISSFHFLATLLVNTLFVLALSAVHLTSMVIPTTSIMSPPVLKVAQFLVRIKETCNAMNYDQLTMFCILSDKGDSKQIPVYTPLSTSLKREKI